jgi:predicted nuclease of predicted toxin-antitoxin system
MKFLLDENVHHGLFRFLVKSGHDVKLSPKSIKNGKVFELAVGEERILISRDADFIDLPLYHPSGHFGIWLLRIHPRDLEAQKRATSKLLEQFPSPEEFKGKVIKILPDEKFEFL